MHGAAIASLPILTTSTGDPTIMAERSPHGAARPALRGKSHWHREQGRLQNTSLLPALLSCIGAGWLGALGAAAGARSAEMLVHAHLCYLHSIPET